MMYNAIMKTPHEKKTQSLARDRRNTFGQNDKASRKLIPRRKRWVNRTFRHQWKLALGTSAASLDEIHERISATKRPRWTKQPDRPLEDILRADVLRTIVELIGAGTSADERFLDRVERALVETTLHPHGVQMIMGRLAWITETARHEEPISESLDYQTARIVLRAVRHAHTASR